MASTVVLTRLPWGVTEEITPFTDGETDSEKADADACGLQAESSAREWSGPRPSSRSSRETLPWRGAAQNPRNVVLRGLELGAIGAAVPDPNAPMCLLPRPAAPFPMSLALGGEDKAIKGTMR